MSIISVLGGRYSALSYAYGITLGVPPLNVGAGNASTGATTITLVTGQTQTEGGVKFSPVAAAVTPSSTNPYPAGATPITVGIGANAETVTPTSVTSSNLGSSAPGPLSVTVTATFANTHGPNEPVISGTFGLQEAINAASANGGGIVQISPAWYNVGGTTTIVQAVSLPSSGLVRIEDSKFNVVWGLAPNSVTVVAAPSAATSSTVASLTTTGTWTAITEHVLFTYVTADGGESLASADYSFTATVSKAIGGTGPAAATGAVGYRVYIGANATTTCYLVPATSANGTVIQCGGVAAFAIGTSFSVATATVAAALPPLVQSTAFPCGVQPIASMNMLQPFSTMQGPFAATGVVTAGTAIEWGKVQIPSAYLNYIGRTLRLTITGNYTPVSTATVIVTVAVGSVYTGTETTVYTVTTPASSGTTNSVLEAQILLSTRVTGATGAVRCHGFNIIGLATGTAGLGAASLDGTTANSSAIDLTGQNYIRVTINSGTANLTTSQCDMLLVETVA